MKQKTRRESFGSDIRTDYALIATGVSAALVAFIYLVLV
jgi:hypothetical protein